MENQWGEESLKLPRRESNNFLKEASPLLRGCPEQNKGCMTDRGHYLGGKKKLLFFKKENIFNFLTLRLTLFCHILLWLYIFYQKSWWQSVILKLVIRCRAGIF